MKTIFMATRKYLDRPYFVKVYQGRDGTPRYIAYYTRRDRERYEEHSWPGEEPIYRINVKRRVGNW